MPWVPPALPVRDDLVTQDFDSLKKYLKTREDLFTTLSATVAAIPAQNGGLSSVGFTASAFSAGVVINHGLGVTPSVVELTSDSSSGAFCVMTYRTLGSTSFTALGWSPGAAITATIPFSWFARV